MPCDDADRFFTRNGEMDRRTSWLDADVGIQIQNIVIFQQRPVKKERFQPYILSTESRATVLGNTDVAISMALAIFSLAFDRRSKSDIIAALPKRKNENTRRHEYTYAILIIYGRQML
ncbi:hypothetical protein D0Z70_00350 [Sphingobium terrigena]|uniref:Uncharacterized protein n=1 Tax=Sphingobium terrigena TaxID=2304063 RepID=A0A418YXV8_9SPHN|nr:hypothetical protein D0Z70_00350 [Sphingobium terrigena]